MSICESFLPAKARVACGRDLEVSLGSSTALEPVATCGAGCSFDGVPERSSRGLGMLAKTLAFSSVKFGISFAFALGLPEEV
jgi:hypothetical protein